MTSLVSLLFRADTSDLDRAQRKLKDTGEQARKAGDKAGLLKSALEKIKGVDGPIGQIATKFEEVGQSAHKAAGLVGQFSGNLSTLGLAMASTVAVGSTLVGILGGIGVALAFRAKDHINDISDLGAKYGYSATQILLFQQYASATGGSLDDILSGFKRVSTAITKSSDETKGAGEAFAFLGVQTHDLNGNLRNSSDVAFDVVRAYDNSSKSTSDLAAAQKILGKDALTVMEALRQAAAAQDEANRLYELGIGISEKGSDATGDFVTAQNKMSLIFDVISSQLIATVLPAFTGLINIMTESYENGGLVADAFTVLKGATELLMGAIRGIISVFVVLDGVITGVERNLIEIAKTVKAFFSLDFDAVKKNFRASGEVMVDEALKTSAKLQKIWAGQGDSFDRAIQAPSTTSAFDISDTAADTAAKAAAEARKDAEERAKKASADRTRELEKQTTLVEKYAALYQRQADTTLELAGVDVKRIALQREATALISEIKGLTEQQRQVMLDQVLAVYDGNKAEEDRKEILKEQLKLQEKLTQEKQRNQRIVDDAIIKSNDKLLGIQREFNDRFLTKQQRDANAQRAAVEDPFKSAISTFQNTANNPASSSVEREDALQRIEVLRQTLDAQRNAVNETVIQQQRLENSVTEGLLRGTTTVVDSLPTLAQGVSGIIQSTTMQLEEGLMSAFTGGEFSVKSFFRTLLQQLLKLTVQLLIIKPLMAMFGGSFGFGASAGSSAAASFGPSVAKLGSGVSGINFLAKGGIVDKPTFLGANTVAGEKNPEAVLPLKRNANGDLGVIAASSGGGMQQVNYINVTVEGGNTNEETGAAVSKSLLDTMKGIARQEIMTQRRVGGSLNPI